MTGCAWGLIVGDGLILDPADGRWRTRTSDLQWVALYVSHALAHTSAHASTQASPNAIPPLGSLGRPSCSLRQALVHNSLLLLTGLSKKNYYGLIELARKRPILTRLPSCPVGAADKQIFLADDENRHAAPQDVKPLSKSSALTSPNQTKEFKEIRTKLID